MAAHAQAVQRTAVPGDLTTLLNTKYTLRLSLSWVYSRAQVVLVLASTWHTREGYVALRSTGCRRYGCYDRINDLGTVTVRWFVSGCCGEALAGLRHARSLPWQQPGCTWTSALEQLLGDSDTAQYSYRPQSLEDGHS